MRKTLKWTLPVALAAVALVGWSLRSAVAQSAAKGKVTVTVKGPNGEVGSSVPVNLFKGTVQMPAFGGGRRGGGGGGGGGGAPASQPAALPTPLATGTTDAKGMYTFENVDAGDITVMAGNMGGGGRRGGGGGGGAAPASQPGVRGRGSATGTVKAGDELKLNINLMAGGGGRGGGGGGGGRRGGGGGGAGAGAGA